MNKSKNIIKDLYEDPVEGFVGISALQEKLKTQGFKFTLQQIKEALSDIDAYTLNKPRKVKIERKKIADIMGHTVQTSLSKYGKYSDFNNN